MILITHCDKTEALDLNKVVTEFVSRSQIHRNKFGVPSSIVPAHFYLIFNLLFVCSVCLFLMVAEKKLKLFFNQQYLFFFIDCLFYSLICN